MRPDGHRFARRRMVRYDLRDRGISDRRVLAAMAWVPRHRFVPLELVGQAYDDGPLPVAAGQTISQPFIVALMTQEARITRLSHVLEIGTGTGYHTAVLAKLARHVWSVERIKVLSDEAGQRLRDLGLRNVTLAVGDGADGCPEAAPFDAIIVTAAAPAAPAPLIRQLALDGRMVIPIGDPDLQDLMIFHRTAAGLRQTDAGKCRFVPFVSDNTFPDDRRRR